MIFESHRAPHVKQMQHAFRNYSPWEFAEFVSRRSGLATYDLLGSADDGRLVFKLTR